MSSNRVHTFYARVVGATEKALKIDCDEVEEYIWLPKSMIQDPEVETLRVGDEEEITIPYSLAQEKGIV